MLEITSGKTLRRDPMLAQPRRFDHRLFASRLGFVLGLCLAALPAKSDPFASAWSEGQAQMRLIAAGGDGASYTAAAEIRLPPTAITYWRTPGDAGVPPTFSTAGSENVAKAEVLFPAPRRINEQGIEAFGYRGGVVFPLHVAAREVDKPVRLRLTVNYAVCDNICLPEESRAELVLPRGAQSPHDAVIAAAEAQVPVALSPQDVAARVHIVPDKAATSPTWLLAWKGDFVPIDLFAEAPTGWVFGTHRRSDGLFSIAAVEEPPTAQRVAVRLTLTGTQNAYEFTTELTLPASALPGEQTTQVAPAGTK
ncbi:MAG: protein-disulfide reductase DsbD domain-containing protein [Methylovirgula sp.]